MESYVYPENVREVFGWFGAAQHNAQFFEGDLLTLHLVLAARQGNASTLSELKNLEASLSCEKTLGQLLRVLREIEPIPTEVDDLWRRALVTRNELTHGFFWKHHTQMMDSKACEKLVNELKLAANLFNEASNAARDLVEKIIISLGIQLNSWREMVKEELHRLYSELDGA